ncbi:septum formation initiator family protein [Streptomyces sp. S1]|uniref:FtsB family cell division protein n=1 Tax=Streptomyces sp. S1 TaxID=718288 RepID=UPI001F08E82D|nr:septum formation initiator family protein [Streptomyces sp. S1]
MSTAKGPLKGRAARLGRLMPSGPSTAARTPFVLLVVVLLGGGLISLLLLNSALNQGSFRLNELKNETTELTDEEQALQRDVDDYAAPDALERRARELGMVPGGSPAFLGPDGKVLGKPSVAVAPPKPSPTPTASAPADPPPASTTPPASTVPPTPPGTATGAAADTGTTGTGTDVQTGTGADSIAADPAATNPAATDPTGTAPARTAPAPTPATAPTTSGR